VKSVRANPGRWLVVEGAFEYGDGKLIVGGDELDPLVFRAFAEDLDDGRLGLLRLTLEAAPELGIKPPTIEQAALARRAARAADEDMAGGRNTITREADPDLAS